MTFSVRFVQPRRRSNLVPLREIVGNFGQGPGLCFPVADERLLPPGDRHRSAFGRCVMQVLMAIFLGLRFLHLDSRVHAAASGDKRVEAFRRDP